MIVTIQLKIDSPADFYEAAMDEQKHGLSDDDYITAIHSTLLLQAEYGAEVVSVAITRGEYKNANEHPKILHGHCPICKHYGDDCTGEL